MGELCEARAGDESPEASEHHALHLRMLEALLFAAAEPLSEAHLSARMPEHVDVRALLLELQAAYAGRGVNLRRADGRWTFRTADDLAFLLRRDAVEEKKLSRAGMETLAIIAYHQPVTRAEIEDVRGVAISKGTLDVLLEAGWVRLRGRRRTPGRPVTFGTTPEFLDHFGLESIGDLPGVGELRAAGLLDTAASVRLDETAPDDNPELADDEDPLDFEMSAFADDAESWESNHRP
jgi:segregation and condensation protein B